MDKLIDRYIILLSSFNISYRNKGNSIIDFIKNLSLLEVNNILLSFPQDSNQYKLIKNISSNNLESRVIKRMETRINTDFTETTNRLYLNTNKELNLLKTNDDSIVQLFNDDNISKIKIINFDEEKSNNVNSKIVESLEKTLKNWVLFTSVLDAATVKVDFDKSNLLRYKFLKPVFFNEEFTPFINTFLLFIEEYDSLRTTFKSYDKEQKAYTLINLLRQHSILENYLKFLQIGVGIFEIPYLTILRLGAILYDKNSLSKPLNSYEQEIKNLGITWDNLVLDDVEFFNDWDENKNLLISEFEKFVNSTSFSNILKEIDEFINKFEPTRQSFVKVDEWKDKLPNLYNLTFNEKKLLISPSYRMWYKKNITIPDGGLDILYFPINTPKQVNFLSKTSGGVYKLIEETLLGSSNSGSNFFQTMQKELKTIISENEKTDKGTTNYLQEALNVSNDIKLETYNSIKGLYDRWIGGNTEKSATDLKSSFVYIDRFYKDIGEKLVINPKMLLNVRENLKMPLYSVISTLLSENRMDFHPLPSFITSFNEIEKLSTDLFNTFTIIDNTTTSEPKFICMYVGGTSKALNEINGNFKSDTPDINNIKDYSNTINPKIGFLPFSFDVNFGSQYQSHFKEIDFDQKQFKVTNESLQIEDEIARSANTRKGIVLGQSLYNVYLQRSYTIRVTGLGNMMIQPLLYFKMNNIPFLKGYYLIINVEHSVKPNYVETIFTGVRISEATIPIVKEYAQFFNLDSYAETSGEIFQVNEGWEKQLKSLGV